MLNGCGLARDTQSIAVFNTPGIEALYSGDTMMQSADSSRERNACDPAGVVRRRFRGRRHRTVRRTRPSTPGRPDVPRRSITVAAKVASRVLIDSAQRRREHQHLQRARVGRCSCAHPPSLWRRDGFVECGEHNVGGLADRVGLGRGAPVDDKRRTATTWPGAAASIARRPCRVITTYAPRRSESHLSFVTSPRSAMRPRWWESRLFSHPSSLASSNSRIRPSGRSVSATSTTVVRIRQARISGELTGQFAFEAHLHELQRPPRARSSRSSSQRT